MITHALTDLPDGAVAHRVTARPADVGGRRAVAVELPDEITRHGRPGIDYVDQPTFLIIPTTFSTGTIAVDVWSRLNGKGMPDSRAFAGLAYRINDRRDAFESVYLRPLNGLRCDPPPPRDRRAIQYFAYPDWPFDRLRDTYPDGRYEAGLAIGPEEWIYLELAVTATTVTATVNGVAALTIEQPKAQPRAGAVGLFVDIGTEAFFSHLTIDTGS
ncbi:hypothetical protein GCM10022204_09440 [Microlunatus aurantiacus]|uniref:Uncharacterized protein n=1 Tax=Microlunatus aurantiacus TaxID=446786 RepID=A0ABP7CVY0_9ACTN